jgi:hypothetical protein
MIILSTLIRVNEHIKCSDEMDPELAEFYANFYPLEDEDHGGEMNAVVDGPEIPNFVAGEEHAGEIEDEAVGDWLANFENVNDYVWMTLVTPSMLLGTNVLVCLYLLSIYLHASYVVFNVRLLLIHLTYLRAAYS